MATTFLSKSNNAKSLITNNPLSNSGLTITVTGGTGAKFPASGQFIVTIWDDTTYPGNPTGDANMEVILCDSRSTDTITVNASGRGYSGTTGVAHASGSAIALQVMKEHFTEHETAINTLETMKGFSAYLSSDTAIATGATVVFDAVDYNIGSNYNVATGIYTVPVTGYYLFGSSMRITSVTDLKIAGLDMTQNAIVFASSVSAASGTAMFCVNTHKIIRATAGDTIKCVLYEDYSGSPTLKGSFGATFFYGQLLIRG